MDIMGTCDQPHTTTEISQGFRNTVLSCRDFSASETTTISRHVGGCALRAEWNTNVCGTLLIMDYRIYYMATVYGLYMDCISTHEYDDISLLMHGLYGLYSYKPFRTTDPSSQPLPHPTRDLSVRPKWRWRWQRIKKHQSVALKARKYGTPNQPPTKTGWWFGTWILFFHILGRIIPIDELIFFRGVGQPPTRKWWLPSGKYRGNWQGDDFTIVTLRCHQAWRAEKWAIHQWFSHYNLHW